MTPARHPGTPGTCSLIGFAGTASAALAAAAGGAWSWGSGNARAQDPSTPAPAQPAPAPVTVSLRCHGFSTDEAIADLLAAVDGIATTCEKNNVADEAIGNARCAFKMCKQNSQTSAGSAPTFSVSLSVRKSLECAAERTTGPAAMEAIAQVTPVPTAVPPYPVTPITTVLSTPLPSLGFGDPVSMSLSLYIPFDGSRTTFSCNNPLTPDVQDYLVRTVTDMYRACQ